MPRTTVLPVVGLFAAIGLAACAGQQQTAAPAAAAPTPVRTEAREVEIEARVERIDQKTRQVTLRGPEGNVRTFTASPEVRNLAQVRKGDTVRLTYRQALAVSLAKAGTDQPRAGEATVASRAEPGEKPAAGAVRTVTVVAAITAIDRAKSQVTLKGPQGNTVDVIVRDPSRLDQVKVGDLVQIDYTEALAVSVEKVAPAQ